MFEFALVDATLVAYKTVQLIAKGVACYSGEVLLQADSEVE